MKVAPHHHEAKVPQPTTRLTGIAKCAVCGKGLVLMIGKSGKFKYYRCATRHSSGNTSEGEMQ